MIQFLNYFRYFCFRKNLIGIDISFQDYSVFVEESVQAVTMVDVLSKYIIQRANGN